MSTSYRSLAPRNSSRATADGDGDGDGGQLHEPTKLLGCLRTVGAPASTANPLLVAAVFGFAVDKGRISRVDVKLVDVASGAVVAKLDRQGHGHLGVTGGLLCLVGTGGTPAAVSVLDPATGDVTAVPALATRDRTASAFVFGHVPATGEHKILRVYAVPGNLYGPGVPSQRCEILTLGVDGADDGDERRRRQQRWRPAASPPARVGTAASRHWAVTAGGVAHFLIPEGAAEHDAVASFDMATETWRPAPLLQGPLASELRRCTVDGLSLVELNGCLAFVHLDNRSHAIDMWVLGEKGAWLRVEPLPLGKVLRDVVEEIMLQPLMVLDDGRIAFWVRTPDGAKVVRVYDPRTGECEETVKFGKLCRFAGLYRGRLLDIDYD